MSAFDIDTLLHAIMFRICYVMFKMAPKLRKTLLSVKIVFFCSIK